MQGENRFESAAYTGVREHFESIFNAAARRHGLVQSVPGRPVRLRSKSRPPRRLSWKVTIGRPSCGSRERHRLFGLMLRARPELGAGARTLHFAPEPLIAAELKARAKEYRTADLRMAGCDLRLDIEALDLPDASVDLFVLNHVIEHVDDRKALAELHRCLAPDGVAAISTPVVEGWRETYEDAGIAHGPDERARILHFGWAGHRRWYGADLRERIRAAGFGLEEFTAGGADAVRYSLARGQTIFLARKTAR